MKEKYSEFLGKIKGVMVFKKNDKYYQLKEAKVSVLKNIDGSTKESVTLDVYDMEKKEYEKFKMESEDIWPAFEALIEAEQKTGYSQLLLFKIDEGVWTLHSIDDTMPELKRMLEKQELKNLSQYIT